MSNRSKKLEGEIGSFVKQYKRKAHAGYDPNDRRYDREIEEKIKHMTAEELSALMSGEEQIGNEIEDKWFNSEPIDGVKYQLNNKVKIVKGKFQGETGVVVSLVELSPEPKYNIELSKGNIIVIIESQTIGLL